MARPTQPSRPCAIAIPVDGEVEVVRISRQPRQQDIEVLHQPPGKLIRRDPEQVFHRRVVDAQAGGRDQHQSPQPVLLADGKAGSKATTERETDEIDVACNPS